MKTLEALNHPGRKVVSSPLFPNTCSLNILQNIVIVGGGTAGANVARPLSLELNPHEYNIVIINPLPFRIWLPAILRLLVQGCDMKDDVFVGYDKLFHFGNGVFVKGMVESFEPGNGRKGGEVVLEGGQKIKYHSLVLSMGSLWEGPPSIPFQLEKVQTHVENYQSNFEKAEHILIVGGGAIGTEIAGEIKDKWPDKKVTIVHAFILLLNPAYTDKFRRTIGRGLQRRGVDVILNDWVDYPRTGDVGKVDIQTRFKESIIAVNYIVHARGPRPNTALVAKSLGDSVLSPIGQIKIQPSLQVEGYDNIFAGGDIIDWPEQRQAMKAAVHGKCIAHNILQQIHGLPMKPYNGQTEMLYLNRGAIYFGFLTGLILKDWAAKRLKGKDLFIPTFKAQQGCA
ncbi:hypothetical protein DL96DRAFT_1471599 [Flagelloscypha sp. PMI_526]|nr:hypothetical protein DL96DRAFT_1471599 [Flagelloscypha sp. PMI_526]